MAILVKHLKVSAIPDSGDDSLIEPSDWNNNHVLTGFGTAAELNAGVANGVATLDSTGKVPVSELPAAVLGALSYQGTWNASTNTPTLTSSIGTKGYYYVVDVAGSTNLNGITDWQIGDWAIFNGTVWQKVDNTDAVTSVNGFTGTVVLTNTDISGFGTMSTQNANSVAITGGAINGTTIGATTAADITGNTINANTKVVSPDYYAQSILGGNLRTSGGTSLVNWDGGGSGNVTINGGLLANPSNKNVSIAPTGTGTATINPSTSGTMNNMVIGGTTPLAGSFTNLSVTGTTSFDGLQGTAGQVLTSSGTGVTPTWASPTTGTVTSVAQTVPSFLSVTGSPITSSGTLAIGYSGTALPIANGGTGATVANGAMANLMGFTSTATAGGTTTLDNTSSYYQLFTGSSTQTVVLPVTSTLQQGWTFHICNNSSGNLTIQSSGTNTVITVGTGNTVMCTCIGTTLTTAADWEAGFTDFSTATGTGSVVLSNGPAINGAMNLTGSTTANSVFGTNITSGTLTIGGTAGTGTITVGQSTVSQTTNIQAGATASGSTKTINFGTGGLTGSTTTINIGPANTGAGTGAVNITCASNFGNTVNFNNVATNVSANNFVGGSFTVGGTAQTGTNTFGQSTATGITNFASGATASGSTKTVNIGTGGLTGSTTTMAIGSTFGTSVTANGTWTYPSTITGSISGNAGTATNGVVTTGSYADPTWITSLAGSKISGTVDGGTF